MRLIDADLVVEKIEAKCNSGQWAEAVVFGMEKALYLVKTAPTVERPRGTWTEEFDESANPFFQRRWRCSACNDYNCYGRSDFCPCCGADMRKQKGGEEE